MDQQRARRITIRRASFGEEDERLDREFWAQMSPDERVEEAWRLSLELWEMKGWDAGEPGLAALLRELFAAEARCLVVGAYAVSFHSRPRGTGDLDVWVEPSPENAARVMRALKAFGAPLSDLKEADLLRPDTVFQIGVPPRRIDLLTSLTGIQFGEAWASRVRGRLGPLECDFIGREVLIKNKRALGRPRDLADLELLEPGRAGGRTE